MGLGFTFMHEYMDEVMVASELERGTKITMIKRVRELES
jgi:anti-sigma regulatory factor (Ser/Thr protein kinase)